VYGQSFTTVNAVSNGNLQFLSSDATFTNTCLPYALANYAILPHWDDLLLTGTNQGIYYSTSGTAPNRIFNIEWTGGYFSGGGTIDMEVRLYEGSSQFDVIYGTITQSGSSATVGVQKDTGSLFAQYECNTGGLSAGQKLTFILGQCGTPGPTNTPTNTNTPTRTPTGPPPPTSTATATQPVVQASATRTNTSTAPPVSTSTRTRTPVPPSPTICPIQFTDVPNGSPFYPYVRCLACRGIINGYTDPARCPSGVPCFRPDDHLTRGQLSKMVSNSAGFSEPHTDQIFEDVPPGSTFYIYIERMASRGYVSGYPCGGPLEPCIPPDNRPYFRPNGEATRGQISKIVSNGAGYTDPPVGQQFEDVTPGSPFYAYIYRLSTRGIISGYPCGGPGEPCIPPNNRPYFRTNNLATRGQASKIVSDTFFPGCQVPQRP
jgi:hypothetical protein